MVLVLRLSDSHHHTMDSNSPLLRSVRLGNSRIKNSIQGNYYVQAVQAVQRDLADCSCGGRRELDSLLASQKRLTDSGGDWIAK